MENGGGVKEMSRRRKEKKIKEEGWGSFPLVEPKKRPVMGLERANIGEDAGHVRTVLVVRAGV